MHPAKEFGGGVGGQECFGFFGFEAHDQSQEIHLVNRVVDLGKNLDDGRRTLPFQVFGQFGSPVHDFTVKRLGFGRLDDFHGGRLRHGLEIGVVLERGLDGDAFESMDEHVERVVGRTFGFLDDAGGTVGEQVVPRRRIDRRVLLRKDQQRLVLAGERRFHGGHRARPTDGDGQKQVGEEHHILEGQKRQRRRRLDAFAFPGARGVFLPFRHAPSR